ncbi:MAG: cytochrome b [Proteobacteria bacterium]|nr:cytochrome b [Pseudomonadota bacterium]
MTTGYLLLALFLAVTLNATNRIVRAIGTLVAALSLTSMVSSIVLADFDGTFALPGKTPVLLWVKPAILNVQAVVGSVGILFLLWAARQQLKRAVATRIPVLNTASLFGRVSRYLHWMIATLILILVPMGMFLSVLAPHSPDRAAFLMAHQALGAAVMILVIVRLLWLIRTPPAKPSAHLGGWEKHTARAAHTALYIVMLAFPVSGILMVLNRGVPLVALGVAIRNPFEPSAAAASFWAALHDWLIPLVFFLLILTHLAAVIKHHFIDHHPADVRRMLR